MVCLRCLTSLRLQGMNRLRAWEPVGLWRRRLPAYICEVIVNTTANSEWIIRRTGHVLQVQTRYAGHPDTSPEQ